jgi:hypothetical protein
VDATHTASEREGNSVVPEADHTGMGLSDLGLRRVGDMDQIVFWRGYLAAPPLIRGVLVNADRN